MNTEINFPVFFSVQSLDPLKRNKTSSCQSQKFSHHMSPLHYCMGFKTCFATNRLRSHTWKHYWWSFQFLFWFSLSDVLNHCHPVSKEIFYGGTRNIFLLLRVSYEPASPDNLRVRANQWWERISVQEPQPKRWRKRLRRRRPGAKFNIGGTGKWGHSFIHVVVVMDTVLRCSDVLSL